MAPWIFFGLGPALPAALAPLDFGLALYFVLAEVMAWFGASMEIALEHFSRSSVLERAEKQGIGDATRTRLDRVHLHELTAHFVRFLGNALLVLGIGFVAFRDHLGTGGSHESLAGDRIAAALGVAFVLTFLINDIGVRHLARRDPDRVVLRGLPALALLSQVIAPIRVPIVALVRLILRTPRDVDVPTARDELKETVEEGEREGTFSSEEADMIGSIIDLKAESVGDVLIPRAGIVMVQEDTPLDEARELINEEGFSRIPVFGKDRDDVVGVLYARDLLRHWPNGTSAELPTVRTMMREAFFVPESKLLPDLLREMRTGKVHMAIVLDEFNGTVGLATIEDILEQIVGEIDDEYDGEPEDAPGAAMRLESGGYQVEGRTAIEDLNKELAVTLPIEDDCETVGGLVFHRLGKVPEAGDRVEVGPVALTVLEADARTVKRLQLEITKRAG